MGKTLKTKKYKHEQEMVRREKFEVVVYVLKKSVIKNSLKM